MQVNCESNASQLRVNDHQQGALEAISIRRSITTAQHSNSITTSPLHKHSSRKLAEHPRKSKTGRARLASTRGIRPTVPCAARSGLLHSYSASVSSLRVNFGAISAAHEFLCSSLQAAAAALEAATEVAGVTEISPGRSSSV